MEASWFDECKPGLAMVAVQCIFTFGTLTVRKLFTTGTSPMIFITYRQVAATLVMVPATLVTRGPSSMALGVRAFGLVFAATLVGCSLNQYFFYQGLKMTSSSMASAMDNLIPAVTFLMSIFCGFEKVKLRSLRNIAKVLGTIICMGGGISMALYKGPKLLNMEFISLSSSLLNSQTMISQWIYGFVFLTASACCGSLWLILQVPICKQYLDPLPFAAWMCILSTLQSTVLTYYFEPNFQSWKISSVFEFFCIIYTGIFVSGITFYLQSWVISVRGPVFSALFNPIQIVMATVFAFLLLNEELHIESLIGATATVSGLYIFLWGKANDQEETSSSLLILRDANAKDGEDDIDGPLLPLRTNNIECHTNKN